MKLLVVILALLLIVLSLLTPGTQSVLCCRSPGDCKDIGSSYDPAPAQPPAGVFNQCPLPLDRDPNLYYVPPNWVQQRPWSGLGTFVVNGTTSGWALEVRQRMACVHGAWCPYACKTGYFEAQFDNLLGQPYAWQTSCNGKDWVIGAGRQPNVCPGTAGSAPYCAGGRQGLYCDYDNVAKVRAPSSEAPLRYQEICRKGVEAVEIVNDTPWPITTCRTVFPGSEIPQIPTEILPGEKQLLTTPAPRENGVSGVWTAGGSTPTGLQFYFMRPQVGNSTCLAPQCQWIVTRPGTDAFSIGGIDYTPYIVEYSPSANANSFDINVRINCDASVAPNAGYSTALGAPMYGIQLIDTNGVKQCDAYWTGPSSPVNDYCNTICRGQGCANKPCSGATCAMTQQNSYSGQVVEPVIKNAAGNDFATGTGLRAACRGGSWNVGGANGPNKIQVRLYPYCNGRECPQTGV